jgi:hypothetical protein
MGCEAFFDFAHLINLGSKYKVRKKATKKAMPARIEIY